MSSNIDWRSMLSSLDRYEKIQNIKTAIEEASGLANTSAQKESFSIENEAYKSSLSIDEYNAACNVSLAPTETQYPDAPEQNQSEHSAVPPGVSIGSYEDCHYVASGVTAEVYRAQTRALKVITETRNIEPHDPLREAKILKLLKKPCIPLLETFKDQEKRFVMVFPYMPLSLDVLITRGPIAHAQVKKHFTDLFKALQYIHDQGIIHRDIKPSALLLESPDGPAYLSDFGTAWHPSLSAMAEPSGHKFLDIGTGPYRAPEVLFGDRSYGCAVDMWGAGAMLAECCRDPPLPLFESRPVHEDGNQLGLILSIFKTMGSPTMQSWPEAASFRTPPFEIYRAFEQRTWEVILPNVRPDIRELVAVLVQYNSNRATASQALEALASCQASPDS